LSKKRVWQPPRKAETVETVAQKPAAEITGLKPGVNEKGQTKFLKELLI